MRSSAVAAVFGLFGLASLSEGVPFRRGSAVVFGLTRGGGGSLDKKSSSSSTEEEYERAEKAILSAIERVEGKVQHAVAAEVDTLFHDQEKRAQAEVAAKAKKAVEHGVSKVKQIVKDHSELHLYPFEKNHPYPTATAPPLHKDHRILHAVESAEKALLHAIQTEVDTLFHADEKEHPKEKTSGATKKSKDPVATGLQKASTKVKNMQTDRRDWLDKSKTSILEDYLSQEYYLE